MRQFERQRTFRHRETGKTSINMVDVLTDQLTVSKGYRLMVRDPGTYRTLFEEVEIVPAMDAVNEEERWLMKLKASTDNFNAQESFNLLTQWLDYCILSAWDSDKFHLVLHSSGYDSRVLGSIIGRLHLLHGNDFTGLLASQNLYAPYGNRSVL